MVERYRVQLDLFGLMKLLALVGFGVGVIAGLALLIYTVMNGGNIIQAVLPMIISPFSNALVTALFGLVSYPFYNWYCNRNRGQILTGRFLKEQEANQDI
ncbi:hypothetical protein SNR37_003878 [Agarivorans aestuarii]|uniref:Uncharacterized protein n=1 Tax=Agarivorans aestuarii TaxID=1563703 RepID=A0ABU7G5K1_9ALTE|nr:MULTISPECIES: hypothetical protein [Agarivorans]MEE1674439.1 hypothetical protein [Agarivorans aestuarii]